MQLALPPRGTPRPCGERTSGTSGTPARQHTHGLMREARTDGETDVPSLERMQTSTPSTPSSRDSNPPRSRRYTKRRDRTTDRMSAIQSVQVFGRKKAATAVAYCKQGRGLIKVNGCPIELLEPEILRLKTFEPVLLLGQTRFANVDIRIRVKGGGFTAQIYAIRQAIAKSLVAYYQKYVDEASKTEIRDILMQYDRTLLVADPRRCESKKFGGPSARARYQKSYR